MIKFYIYKHLFFLFVFMILCSTYGVFKISEKIVAHENDFLNQIGLRSKATKVLALKDAMYWEYRCIKNVNRDVYDYRPIQRVYGNLYSLDRETGELYFEYYANDKITVSKGRLANIQIVDLNRVAQSLLEFKKKQFEFEVFPDGRIIAWCGHQKIWNLILVQNGSAVPEKHPPTNIVDRLFANFYWQKFKDET